GERTPDCRDYRPGGIWRVEGNIGVVCVDKPVQSREVAVVAADIPKGIYRRRRGAVGAVARRIQGCVSAIDVDEAVLSLAGSILIIAHNASAAVNAGGGSVVGYYQDASGQRQ